MDEWCAVWFWPTDEESLQHVPTPLTFHAEPSEARSAIIDRLASDVKFFHWELEFPDVFTPERSGFDAMIGNPPWDVMKPNSQEFFSDSTRSTGPTTSRRRSAGSRTSLIPCRDWQMPWDEYNARFKALGNWARNAADPFDLSLARGNEGSALASAWARRRQQRVGVRRPGPPLPAPGQRRPELLQDVCRGLLESSAGRNGRLGVILPNRHLLRLRDQGSSGSAVEQGSDRLPVCVSEREDESSLPPITRSSRWL